MYFERIDALRINVLLSLVILSISSCATGRGSYIDNAEINIRDPLPTVEKDKSLIFFVREWQFTGGGAETHIAVDNLIIGSIKARGYIYKHLDPGLCKVSALLKLKKKSDYSTENELSDFFYSHEDPIDTFYNYQNRKNVDLLVEANKVYYIKIYYTTIWGPNSDYMHIEIITPDEGIKLLKKIRGR